MVDEKDKKVNHSVELGVTGLKHSSGYIYEEYLPQLKGDKGRKVFVEMRDNDATVGALLSAIDLILRSVNWRVEPVDESSQAIEAAEWLESNMGDMSGTWEDFISEVLTMLTFGWTYMEHVFKRRIGPDEEDASRKSKFTDGTIGIKKICIRAQESLDKWELDDNGGIKGMWQYPPNGGATIFIPIEKALLFRTSTHKNNPEGKSILRNAYRSYHFMKNIQTIESIAIERELAGLPIVRIPQQYLTDSDFAAVKNSYIQAARDLKFNEQGALVIPSDTFADAAGNPTTVRKVDVELMSASGTRSVDTDMIIKRYEGNIARTVLADFLLLGSNDRGSFALSKDKTNFFVASINGYLKSTASVLNRNLVPRIWKINGFDSSLMPAFSFGEISPVDVKEFGDFIAKITSAGFIVAGDKESEKVVRNAGGLPETIDEENLFDGGNPNNDSDDEMGNGDRE